MTPQNEVRTLEQELGERIRKTIEAFNAEHPKYVFNLTGQIVPVVVGQPKLPQMPQGAMQPSEQKVVRAKDLDEAKKIAEGVHKKRAKDLKNENNEGEKPTEK